MPASIAAWQAWFTAWFAAFWDPSLVPGLRQLIRLHDEVERGDFVRAGELRLGMDTYGISPKGQQALHWKKPSAEDKPAGRREAAGSRYGHLRAVEGG